MVVDELLVGDGDASDNALLGPLTLEISPHHKELDVADASRLVEIDSTERSPNVIHLLGAECLISLPLFLLLV